jgi:hypothetical protein
MAATGTKNLLLIMAVHFQEAISCSSRFWLCCFKGSQSLPLRGDYYGRHFWHSIVKLIMAVY